MSVMDFNPWQVLARHSSPNASCGSAEAIEVPLAKLAILADEDAEIAKRDEAAEREAIQSEPLIPPPGSAERAKMDQKQAEICRGLLRAFTLNKRLQRGE